ncbi:hypothetical protein [Simkania sp.]|uniref:hypothetical protein n=1 Tax=Simkania sp. TaxID=34094 RepID=UPI003B517CC0
MFRVHLLSALYVSPPPIPKQKLFDNNITAIVVNFSEYLFSIPCKYPNYVASLNLDLTEVQTSTLKRIGLVALWVLFGVCWKSLWKVVTVLAVIKVSNRLGFAEPPTPQTYSRRNPKPVRKPPPTKLPPPIKPTDSPKTYNPPPNSVGPRRVRWEEPKPPRSSDLEDSMFEGFVFVEDEKDSERKDPPPSQDLSASRNFVIVNPDEIEDSAARILGSDWVMLDEYEPDPPVSSDVSSSVGSFVMIDSYIGDQQ